MTKDSDMDGERDDGALGGAAEPAPLELTFPTRRPIRRSLSAAVAPDVAIEDDDADPGEKMAALSARLRDRAAAGVAPRPRPAGLGQDSFTAAPEPSPAPAQARATVEDHRPTPVWSWAAAGVSIGWLGVVGWRASLPAGQSWLATASLDQLALALFGALAPIFALWLVIGQIRAAAAHRAELRGLRAAVTLLEGQSASSTLTEAHLRLETYLRMSSFYLDAMAREAATLAQGLKGHDAQEDDRLWGRYAQGDRDVFFRFFARYEGDVAEDLAALIARDDEAARAAHALSGHYAVFLTLADDVDRGNLMTEAHRRGDLGRLADILNVALYGDADPFGVVRAT